jgi:aspartyl-tRNA(Asn)/glutamyl-tRNA(Gln) amidotransferase subunit A
MNVKLPPTISGLHQELAQGHLDYPTVVAHQREQFHRLGQRLETVTHYLPVDVNRGFDKNKPLSGVGLAHKDIFDLPGRSPGLGRGADREQRQEKDRFIPAAPTHTVPKHSAPAIQALQQAGALNLGALAMAEDACAATGQTAQLPSALNPLGKHLAVGGSSSGSAVAVAAGMVYGSLGTDTAGSVRIPAMTCGVMGLKTTHGLISTQGVTPLSPSLDSVGLLARSVQDLACLFGALAKDRPIDAGASQPRTAYWLKGVSLNDNIRAVVEPILLAYGSASLDLSTHEHRATVLQQVIMVRETGLIHSDRILSGRACRQVVDLGTVGLAAPVHWLKEALRIRTRCARAFIEYAFASADVLLLPLQVASLPRADEVYTGAANFEPRKLLALHRYCGWLNYLGLPALALPVGFDAEGLPVSIQLVARPFHEHHLLAVGQKMQQDLLGTNGIAPVCHIQE